MSSFTSNYLALLNLTSITADEIDLNGSVFTSIPTGPTGYTGMTGYTWE